MCRFLFLQEKSVDSAAHADYCQVLTFLVEVLRPRHQRML